MDSVYESDNWSDHVRDQVGGDEGVRYVRRSRLLERRNLDFVKCTRCRLDKQKVRSPASQ
jgi:hypothetical protein